MSYWKNWKELKQVGKDREIIFYGRSEDWVPKSLPYITPYAIVDSNPEYFDTKYEGCSVISLEKIINEKSIVPYFVITTGQYASVAELLESLGYMAGVDFCCCPEYKDYGFLDTVRTYDKEVIVTSPDYKSGNATRFSRAGGGIFQIQLGSSQADYNVNKIVDGQYRQIIKHEDYYVAVEFNKAELHVFDKDMSFCDAYKLDRPHYCGLDYCAKNKVFYTANASTDEILMLDSDFNPIDKIPFSSKSGDHGKSYHHINDLTVDNGNLFVSYFSNSGNWKYDIFDGGASVWNGDEGVFTPVIRDLWQPHSPKIFDGNFHILDSNRGKFYSDTYKVSAEFPGFLRGLDYNGEYYIIGMSESMYSSRLIGVSNNIMMNAGVFLYEPITHASRFYPLLDVANIHSILFKQEST